MHTHGAEYCRGKRPDYTRMLHPSRIQHRDKRGIPTVISVTNRGDAEYRPQIGGRRIVCS